MANEVEGKGVASPSAAVKSPRGAIDALRSASDPASALGEAPVWFFGAFPGEVYERVEHIPWRRRSGLPAATRCTRRACSA
jgi:hypothetical protein